MCLASVACGWNSATWASIGNGQYCERGGRAFTPVPLPAPFRSGRGWGGGCDGAGRGWGDGGLQATAERARSRMRPCGWASPLRASSMPTPATKPTPAPEPPPAGASCRLVRCRCPCKRRSLFLCRCRRGLAASTACPGLTEALSSVGIYGA